MIQIATIIFRLDTSRNSPLWDNVRGSGRTITWWDDKAGEKGKHFESVLSLQFLSMHSERWLNSDRGWSSGGIQPLLAQKNEGHGEVASFPSNWAVWEFKQDTVGEGVIKNIVEEFSSEMLSDSAMQSKKTGYGLRVSLRMLLLCPCLRVYNCFLLLFSLPRLPGAGTHYFCCCHSAVQHERWFKTLLPQTKYNYLRDKWAENYTVKYANGCWTTGRKFCIFNPSELHSPLLLPKQVCNITAGIWASFPFVEACEDSLMKWKNMTKLCSSCIN